MKFHLQLFPPRLSDWVIVLLVLFLPAALAAYALHSLVWLAVVPFGIIVLALCIAAEEASESMIQVFTMQQPPADLLISITPGVRKLVEAAESLGP